MPLVSHRRCGTSGARATCRCAVRRQAVWHYLRCAPSLPLRTKLPISCSCSLLPPPPKKHTAAILCPLMTSFCVWSRQLLADDPTKRAIYTDAHTSGMVPRWRDIAAMITTKTALIELPPPESLTALKRESTRAESRAGRESRELVRPRLGKAPAEREREREQESRERGTEREGQDQGQAASAPRQAARLRDRHLLEPVALCRAQCRADRRLISMGGTSEAIQVPLSIFCMEN